MSKTIKPSVLSLAIAQAIAASAPALAETIDLGNGCTLTDAITSANLDTETGNCIAGDGADVINLEAGVDVVLERFGTTPNGLPVITSEITINGGGAAIERDISNPDKFRLMEVSTANGMLTLNSVTLANGYAYSFDFPNFHGGGIYLNESASLVGNSLTVTGNRAKRSINSSGNGGGINATGATVELNDSLVSGNSGSSLGGGVYVMSGSLIVNSTVISNNTAEVGAGINMFATSLTGNSVTISDNSAAVGGGMNASFNSNVELTDSTINNNNATSLAGGIRSDDLSPITLIDTLLTGNSAGERGGGLFANRTAEIIVSGGSVSDNTAGRYGGAIYARLSSSITLQSTIVSGNTTSETIGSRYGGGVLIKESATLTSSDTQWINNYSLFGGAIATQSPIEGAAININNDTFSNNSAGQGAAFFNRAELTVINSTISNNSASNTGGAFSHSDNHTLVINSTITGNQAMNSGGGISTFNTGSLSLYNNIIAGNIAPIGAEISDAGSLITMHSNNVLGSNAVSSANAFNVFIPNTSDIVATSDSPARSFSLASIVGRLADNGGPTLTHGLIANSPALNSGSQTVCVANSIDQDQRGEPRDDGQCDIGAIEGALEDESCYVVKAANGNTLVFCL